MIVEMKKLILGIMLVGVILLGLSHEGEQYNLTMLGWNLHRGH
jgi:hypothetical protein